MSSAWPGSVASPLTLPARLVCTCRKASAPEPPLSEGWFGMARAPSADLGGLGVPAELDVAARTTLIVLRLVGEPDVTVRHRDGLGNLAAAAARRMHRGDENFLEHDLEEILLTFA